jgi:hypothetical protein
MAFNHYGWGRLALDYRKYARGLLVAEVADGPSPDALLAGLLAGLFSHFTGEDLDCISTGKFVIGLPGRLGRFAGAVAEGRSHDDIVRDLAATHV